MKPYETATPWSGFFCRHRDESSNDSHLNVIERKRLWTPTKPECEGWP